MADEKYKNTLYDGRLQRQVGKLAFKVGQAKDKVQRAALSEFVGVAYALECARLPERDRPSNKERARELAFRRARYGAMTPSLALEQIMQDLSMPVSSDRPETPETPAPQATI